MDKTEMISMLIDVLILPLLAWAVSEFRKYISAKIKNEKAEKYVNLATDAVYTAVQQTMQTYVSTLKKNGEWNEESAQKAFEQTKVTAIAVMGEEAKNAVVELTGDFDAWITAKIEAYTLQIKAEG